MKNIDPVEKWTYIVLPIAVFLLIIIVSVVFRMESKSEECQRISGQPIWIHGTGIICLEKGMVIQLSGS